MNMKNDCANNKFNIYLIQFLKHVRPHIWC